MGKTIFEAKHKTRTPKGGDDGEAGCHLNSEIESARPGTRSKSSGPSQMSSAPPQIHPLHGPQSTVSSDRGSPDSSGDHLKTSRNKVAGILRRGITSIYKEYALAMLRFELESNSMAEVDSFDRNMLDHEVGQEFINQRELELAQSHLRMKSDSTTCPIAITQDWKSASSRKLAEDLNTQIDPIENSNLHRPTKNRRNVAFVGSTVGPPPPCSQCDNDQHTDYCKLRRFSSEKLAEVTDGFSADNNFGYQHEQLFKGILDGQRVYVVRREPHEKVKVFSEVDMLRSIKHPNIVNLIGYCDEDDHLALVFGFVCNRCLSFHLDVKNLKCSMQWPHRANLAVQVATGLAYLHDNSIIHGNVNSSYVFVHRDFTPLIAQFSLSRRIADGYEVIDEDRSGDKKSRGYLAPEYVPGGKLSMPQDVYAFGVILFELITGRPAFYRVNKTEIYLGERGRETVEAAQPSDEFNLPRTMLDRRLEGTKFNECDVLRMMRVAARCTQKDPNARPLMREVLEMLTSDVEFRLAQSLCADISDGEDQVETGSQVQEMLNGDSESEGSQTSEDPDACEVQVHLTVDQDIDAMETGRTTTSSAGSSDDNEDLTIKKMAGKFLRELKGSASEFNKLLHKVPLKPPAQHLRNENDIPSFNYYQKRITVRRMIMAGPPPPPPVKSSRRPARRPATPGHRLHKNRPVYNPDEESCDHSLPSLQSSASHSRRLSSVQAGEFRMSPVRFNVIIKSYIPTSLGANSASKFGKRVKFTNQRSWPMSVLLPDHYQ